MTESDDTLLKNLLSEIEQLGVVELRVALADLLDGLFLGVPAGGEGVELLADVGELLAQFLFPVLGGEVAFQCLQLDFDLHLLP